jgi:hypothetical protein
MSWAARRRLLYILGIVLFFVVVFVLPVVWLWYRSIPPACPEGTMRATGDTSGPCNYLVEQSLQPHAVLWSRAFKVRDGVYDAVAYIQNTNPAAGALAAPYQFSFYDEQNILVAQKSGTAFIMPQSVTPIFVADVSSGNRNIAHTYFQLAEPLTWQKLANAADGIAIDSKVASQVASTPTVTAIARNTTVSDVRYLAFVAVVFDTAGNAIAASQTALPILKAKDTQQITFTWPTPFTETIGRIDVLPVLPPARISG